ncbi:sel1 repeat family protein [Oxalobacter formigenes]|uniref:SEL1-like repeat protein n=1 Tax=Oxalobacter formigenes TaxID=847 RepID=UPI0022AFF8AF|nr:tetratricopeptide repeat protein [Oxalobacter formigenes]WAW06441.1 sel1 repeat family protein [Oxalobacter formigenes]
MKNIFRIFYIVIVALILCSCEESNDKVIENNGFEYYKERQYEKALPLLEKAARDGDSDAPFYLGMMYDDGKGVKKDENISFDWFETAAKNGNKDAYFIIGKRLFIGKGTEKNYKEALKWLKKSVHEGKNENKKTYALIGIMYLKGLGTLSDPSESAKWFEKAAILGDSNAQALLATQYYDGQGILTNIEKARYWAEKSAEQGDESGDYMLGMIYEFRAPELDMEKAIAEYEKASGKGMPPATFRLAQIYDEGKGVGKNRKKALQLYKLAAKQGSIEAMEKIREFEKASLAK